MEKCFQIVAQYMALMSYYINIIYTYMYTYYIMKECIVLAAVEFREWKFEEIF